MFFRQLIDPDMRGASYVIADAGDGIVVDPGVAIDQYLELACRHRFGIAHLVETRAHVGRASGARGLAELTGAAIDALRPGDAISVGSARLTASVTPGQRPGGLALVLSDRRRCGEPLALLSGDALLAGDAERWLRAAAGVLGAAGLVAGDLECAC